MTIKNIYVKGAREHNLKNIDVTIPRDKFVVITGLSGSGKSSLAFDTIYAEGQRRYVESLSAYARQFLGQMEKPNVEYIEGLSPAISIDQKTTSRNPRSTVGTVTEIYDYLRLLFARVGIPHCPICHREISSQSVDQIIDQIMALPEDAKLQILAPVVRGKKGEHKRELAHLKKEGFVRVRVDGELRELSEEIELEKTKKHTLEVVVDRVKLKEGVEKRLTDSVETALNLSDGLLIVNHMKEEGNEDLLFNTNFSCPEHNVGIAEMEPRTFSFNSPYGACETCKGIGHMLKIDPEMVVPEPHLTIAEGAIEPFANSAEGTYYAKLIEAVILDNKCSMDTPYSELPENVKEELMYGTGSREIAMEFESKYGGLRKWRAPFEGVVGNLERRYRETTSDYMRGRIEQYMSLIPCDVCEGKRLKDEVLAVEVDGKNIWELTELSVREAIRFFEELEMDEKREAIAEQILKEINARLSFLRDVGLDYLSLSRSAGTLSGGEAQRIRLATQIGSRLMGVLYILDEPSIGLHQKDNEKLLKTLRELTDIGNTLIVVEHDEDTIRQADHILDIGPGAGEHGGEIIAEGTIDEILANEASITGQYLSGKKSIALPDFRRAADRGAVEIIGARENNLKGIDVAIPLGVFTCVTGVSGSGKSSLINEILYKAASNKFYRSKAKPGRHDKILGLEQLDKVIDIDQSPIGRTPRSNPATYTGVFDHIRDLFAQVPDAKLRGYKKGRFSFNVKGGRCEACKGDGIIKIEMNFLPDVYVECEVCKGKRYNRETLEVKYKGKSISEVLDMTVEEGLKFFEHIPQIQRKLQTLHDVGLDYIRLGQPSTQLSGGEAQRIKLATELSKRSTGQTLYILDEPTTGLHIADVHNLIHVLDRLVEGGNTVVVIEHNLDMIKTADHLIDLGPDGGDKGGTIVGVGTPEEIAALEASYTGQFLKRIL
ncbi:MAG: excinuclease ABC subunit UvrA [Clostridia bacterium]|nr:excinuclease ABC subunit UvrA [Clostridia bacterium]